MALVSASTGPSPSARVVATVESPTESSHERLDKAVADLVRLVEDAPALDAKRFRSVFCTFMQARLERDLAGREAAALDHRLVGVDQRLRLRGVERHAQRLGEQHDVGAARLAIDADDGVGAHLRRIAPQVSAGVLPLAAAVHAGPGAERARAHNGRAVRHIQAKSRVGGVCQAGEPASDSGGTNSASPRSCMPPMTVVRFTLPQRSPVPSSVPCTCAAPARIAGRALASPRPRSVCPWNPNLTPG